MGGREWSSQVPQRRSNTIFMEGELITLSGNGAIPKSFGY